MLHPNLARAFSLRWPDVGDVNLARHSLSSTDSSNISPSNYSMFYFPSLSLLFCLIIYVSCVWLPHKPLQKPVFLVMVELEWAGIQQYYVTTASLPDHHILTAGARAEVVCPWMSSSLVEIHSMGSKRMYKREPLWHAKYTPVSRGKITTVWEALGESNKNV